MFKRTPKEPMVNVFYVTDLHGSQVAFRKFLNAAEAYGVDALICGGDVAGKQMYPIVPDKAGVQCVELDGRTHRLDSTEAIAEAKSAIGSRGGYGVELSHEEAQRAGQGRGRPRRSVHAPGPGAPRGMDRTGRGATQGLRHQDLYHRRQR